MLFYRGFDRNNKKRWIPIFMGMTDKMGTIHRAPTLRKNKRQEKDGLDESSSYIRKTKKIVLEKGKFRMFFNLNLFLFLRLLVFFC
ncbi:hypothetical protein ES705_28494 [subsurface metagenome]